jgi:excisionase family DNA binding protein
MSDELSEILTIPEVAKYLRMSPSKVYYLVAQGAIPHLKIGRNVRIRRRDLDKWLVQHVGGNGDVWYTPGWK